MTSTFKLTKAEFKKIFKRPSIFIMAIILVVAIFVSISIFNPVVLPTTTITYDGASTAQEYYTIFNDPLEPVSKKSIDDLVLNTNNNIEYYRALNTNKATLLQYYSDTTSAMHLMQQETNSVAKDNYRKDFANSLAEFIDAYLLLESMSQFDEIRKFTTDTLQFEDYQGEHNFYLNNGTIEILKEVLDDANNTSITTYDFIDTYNTNNYSKSLNNALDNGSNFIYTTIKGYNHTLSTTFKIFEQYFLSINPTAHIGKITTTRKNLLTIVSNYEKYLKLLFESETPLILIDHEDFLTMDRLLTEAKSLLSNSNSTLISEITAIKDELKRLNFINILDSFTKEPATSPNAKIKQVFLSTKTISDMDKISETVKGNQEVIINNIDSMKLDESFKDISKEMTKYSQLQTTYSQIISDKIMYTITENFDKSTYSNFHGYDFDEFNKYQAKEQITKCSYYIDNNEYSNSFINNFSYNQNSGQETNAFDFMYFAMELCTLIIIVFAMMLVCNLITGETESGTIKLLLVRPYKRSKILSAKILASIFFVLTFMIFSSIITFVGGCFVYGYTSTPILAVFNGSTAFAISPIVLMIINILTLTLDAIFFVFLGVMLSILCKNYAGAITCSIVLLIVNYALNILFGGTFWYTLLPGMNLHLFKYFGNAFMISGTGMGLGGLIQALLITGIESSMTIWYSLLVTLAYSIVFLAVSYSVFEKRDF